MWIRDQEHLGAVKTDLSLNALYFIYKVYKMLYIYSLSPENSPAFSGETGLFVFSKNLRQYRWCSSHRDGPRPFTEPVHVPLKYDNPAGLFSHLLSLRKSLLVLEILGFLSVHLKGKYIDAFFFLFFAMDAVNGYLISN